MTDELYIVTTVPESHVNAVLDAIASAGGGQIGSYTHCAFTHTGVGRFKPAGDAHPHIGAVGEINAVDEWRIETFCARSQGRAVVDAIRAAHPYEQPVIYVIPLLDPDTL
ncbi:MAG: hypothetical protein OZ933_13325 [Chloroflexota bacterium]|nr:hypothetical protein [Chloroflexota bacterium]